MRKIASPRPAFRGCTSGDNHPGLPVVRTIHALQLSPVLAPAVLAVGLDQLGQEPGRSDAIAIVCTKLRAAQLAADLERQHGMPVIDPLAAAVHAPQPCGPPVQLGGMVGVVLALTVIVVVPTALALTWLGPLASAAVRIRSFALLLGFTMLGPAFLYRFAPCVTTRRPGPLRRTIGGRPRHGPRPRSGPPRS